MTFKTLLSVKQRREQKIRLAIEQISFRQNALIQHSEQITLKRDLGLQQWRDFSSGEQILTPEEWQKFRIKMAEHDQQDQHLLVQTEMIRRQYAELEAEKEDQGRQLRQILLKQEKLKILMLNYV